MEIVLYVTFAISGAAMSDMNVIPASDIGRSVWRRGMGCVCVVAVSEIGQHLARVHIPHRDRKFVFVQDSILRLFLK